MYICINIPLYVTYTPLHVFLYNSITVLQMPSVEVQWFTKTANILFKMETIVANNAHYLNTSAN